MLTNITLVNIDIDLMQDQYMEFINTTPDGSIVWGLIEAIGNAMESKGISYEPSY